MHITCKHLWKLILPLQMSPCCIMDLSLAFWSYKISPFHRLIHNPLSSLSWTITTCKLLWSGLLLVLQILPLWNQTPKSKVNGPRVHFPYNIPLFGDWWQHDHSKQIIKILEFKNYLLAMTQCKWQGYMMLKDTNWRY